MLFVSLLLYLFWHKCLPSVVLIVTFFLLYWYGYLYMKPCIIQSNQWDVLPVDVMDFLFFVNIKKSERFVSDICI